MKTSSGILAVLLVVFGFLISIGGLFVKENIIIYICGMILMIIGNLILWFNDIGRLFGKQEIDGE